MAMSRNRSTEVMLRELILSLDRQTRAIGQLTEVVRHLAMSNDDLVESLASGVDEDGGEVATMVQPTHLGQTMDSLINDLNSGKRV